MNVFKIFFYLLLATVGEWKAQERGHESSMLRRFIEGIKLFDRDLPVSMRLNIFNTIFNFAFMA